MIVEQLKAIFTLDSSGFEAGMKKAKKDMDSAKQSAKGMSSSISGLGSSFSSATKNLTIATAAITGFGAATVGTTIKLANMAAEIDSLQRGLRFATGGAKQGQEAFKFLQATTDRLGISIEKTSTAFKTMAAASLNTSLEGEKLKEIYLALAEASAVVGLSQFQTERMFYAVQQMMSKGVINAEEFRQQLGEHLPMATRVMAKAMGVTIAELNKMMSLGILLSENVLPAFSKELRNEVADAAEEASFSIRASLARLSNAWFLAKKEIFEGPTSTNLQISIDLLTKAVKALPALWRTMEASMSPLINTIGLLTTAYKNLAIEMDNLGNVSFKLPDVDIKATVDVEGSLDTSGLIDSNKAETEITDALEGLRQTFQDKFASMTRELQFESDAASLAFEDSFSRAELVIKKKMDQRLAATKEFYDLQFKTLGKEKEKEVALTKEYNDIIANIQLTADKQLGALRLQQQASDLQALKDQFEKTYGSIISFVESSATKITEALVEMSFGGKKSFKELTDSILKDLQRLIYQIFVIEPIIKGFRKLLSDPIPTQEGLLGMFTGEGIGGGLIGSLLGFAQKIFGFSTGGLIQEPVAGIGLRSGSGYALGESGTEMVSPVGAGGTSGQNVVVNINALDSKSLVDLMDRNPQAVIGPLVGALQSGDRGIQTALRGSM